MISKTEPDKFNKKFDVVSCFVDCGGKTLLLLRQDHKPQGNTWAMVAGKVEDGEDMARAMCREMKEEIGLRIPPEKLRYFEKLYVRYPDYDYVYHIYSLTLPDEPALDLNSDEHKSYQWIEPDKALGLDLIQYEDYCIKLYYGI